MCNHSSDRSAEIIRNLIEYVIETVSNQDEIRSVLCDYIGITKQELAEFGYNGD